MRARINAPGVAGPILRLIIGVSILLVFGLAGNRLIALYSIPLPGAVVGLVLLAGALAIARRVSAPGTAWLPENVAPASRALLNHLGLLFVPAGCAVLTEGDVLGEAGFPFWRRLSCQQLSALQYVAGSCIALSRAGRNNARPRVPARPGGQSVLAGGHGERVFDRACCAEIVARQPGR